MSHCIVSLTTTSDYVKLLGQVLCLFLLLPTALTYWFIHSELNAGLSLSTWELLQVCVSQSSTSAMGQFCWRKAQAVSPDLEARRESAPFHAECWIPASWTSTDTDAGLSLAHLIQETNSSINERKWRNKRVTSQNFVMCNIFPWEHVMYYTRWLIMSWDQFHSSEEMKCLPCSHAGSS